MVRFAYYHNILRFASVVCADRFAQFGCDVPAVGRGRSAAGASTERDRTIKIICPTKNPVFSMLFGPHGTEGHHFSYNYPQLFFLQGFYIKHCPLCPIVLKNLVFSMVFYGTVVGQNKDITAQNATK